MNPRLFLLSFSAKHPHFPPHPPPPTQYAEELEQYETAHARWEKQMALQERPARVDGKGLQAKNAAASSDTTSNNVSSFAVAACGGANAPHGIRKDAAVLTARKAHTDP